MKKEESESQQLGQHQTVGDVESQGDGNTTAFVNAGGNTTIDQSRQIIYNYYYRGDSSILVESDTLLVEQLPCPYRGLFHFGPNDAEYFFGREVFIAELVQAVQTHIFVPVLGASGSGKSSVVLAGLVPRLQQTGHWKFTHFRPGDDPFHALALALIPLYTPALDATDQIAQSRKLTKYLREGEVLLTDVIAKIQQNYPTDRVLLIADQFEELYTLCSQDTIRRNFLDCLLASLPTTNSSHPSSIVLVATMRADFLGNALQYRPFADLLQKADIKLGAMNRAELAQVIEQPAEKLGVMFEAGLVNRILDDVENQPGNLPLLEFALTEMWERRKGKQVTHAAYEAIGEVEGALARYADDKYASLNSAEQEQMRRIFVQLVCPGEGTEDSRRLATKAEVGEEKWLLVKQLADVRLVVTSQDTTKQETVEVVHEALIRNWGKLRQWMATDRVFRSWQERLRVMMRQWQETHQDEESLLRGAALVEAEEQLQQRQEDLSQTEKAFIQQSIDLYDRLKQAEIKRRRHELKTAWGIATGASIAVLVSSGLGIMAWQQQKRAELNQANALGQSSLLLFDSDKDLDALIDGIRAGKILKQKNVTDPLVISALQTVVYGAREYNRLIGHTDVVYSVAFSPNGQTIATASEDNTVKLWDLDGRLLRTLSGHLDAVTKVAFSSDGNIIATASDDKTVKLWSLDGQLLRTLVGHKDLVYGIAFDPNRQTIATASRDKTVKLWDLKGHQLRTFTGHTDVVFGVAFSPNGQIIATASRDKTIKLWDLKGHQLHTLAGHTAGVNSVTFSPNGQTIATASRDKTVKLWDLKGHQLHTLAGHMDWVNSAAFSFDGQTIATTSYDNTVKLWNLEGQLFYTLTGHTDAVMSAAFSPNGQALATASYDHTVRLWNMKGQKRHTLSGHTAEVANVAFSPDGKTIATASWDNTAKLWNLEGEEQRTLIGHTYGVTSVTFRPDGKVIATASDDKTVKLWDLKGQLLHTLHGHSYGVYGVAFSSDGQTIATASYDKTVKLWNSEGQLLHTLTGHTDWLTGVAFSPNSQTLVTTSRDKTAKLWNLKGKLLHTFTGHTNWLTSITFSPDGQTIATASDDKTAKIWSLKGQLLQTLVGHTDEVASVAFSPSGQIIATASRDKTVKIWSLEGQLLQTLTGHTAKVTSISFSSDGQTFATASGDTTVKLWNVEKLGLDSLIVSACDWTSNYLQNSQEVEASDRTLCKGLK